MDKNLTVYVQFNVQDMKEYYFYKIQNNLKAVPGLLMYSLLRTFLGMAIISFVGTVINDVYNTSSFKIDFLVIGMIIILIIALFPILLIIFGTIGFLISYLSYKKKTISNEIVEPLISIDFNCNNSTVKGPKIDTSYNWSEVLKIEEIPSLFEITIKSKSEKVHSLFGMTFNSPECSIRIPKRCFENETELDSFLELITQKVNKDKLFLIDM